MYVLHVPTVNARTYIEEKKLLAAVRTYLLLHVCTYCTYLVLVYLLMYARTYCIYRCFYWCTYVPTIRTALAYATSTHLLHKTAVPTVRTYCCTYSWWCMYLSAVVHTSCIYYKYLLMTYVSKEKPRSTSKIWQGTIRLLKQSQHPHPNEGETGRKSCLNRNWLAFLNDGRNGQHACRLLMYIVQDLP